VKSGKLIVSMLERFIPPQLDYKDTRERVKGPFHDSLDIGVSKSTQ